MSRTAITILNRPKIIYHLSYFYCAPGYMGGVLKTYPPARKTPVRIGGGWLTAIQCMACSKFRLIINMVFKLYKNCFKKWVFYFFGNNTQRDTISQLCLYSFKAGACTKNKLGISKRAVGGR